MNTLVDFVTQTKGMEYLLAIGFIFGYAVFFEFLRPGPFAGLARDVRQDLDYLRSSGGRNDMRRLARNMLKLPLVAGAYLFALPAYFIMGIGLKVEGALAGTFAGGSMAWRPLESYLTGRANKRGRRVAGSKKEGAQ